MSQVTWRASDELVDGVRAAARHSGRSLNEFVTLVLTAAVDPDMEGDEVERIRLRLDRAGVLAPASTPARRPDAARVASARRALVAGPSSADLVSDGRR